MVHQKFILESTFNKVIYLIIYFTVLLLILIIYLSLRYLNIGWAQYITVFISIILSILIILYREKIVRQINSCYVNYKIKKVKRKDKVNLQRTMRELSDNIITKEKRRIREKKINIEKLNLKGLKSKVKKLNKLFKKKNKYIEIK